MSKTCALCSADTVFSLSYEIGEKPYTHKTQYFPLCTNCWNSHEESELIRKLQKIDQVTVTI
jgi:hypothetical protein